MTELAVETANRSAAPWFKNKKLDQYICFWSVPVFYTLFGLVFVTLSYMMPPRSPAAGIAEVVSFM